MRLADRWLWLLALLCVAALATTTVHSLIEDKIEERGAQSEGEYIEEGPEGFDYDSADESEIGHVPENQEYGNSLPPPPPYPLPPQIAYSLPPPYPYPEQPIAYRPVPVPSYSVPAYQEQAYIAPLSQRPYVESYVSPVYQQSSYNQSAPAYQQASYPEPIQQQRAIYPSQQQIQQQIPQKQVYQQPQSNSTYAPIKQAISYQQPQQQQQQQYAQPIKANYSQAAVVRPQAIYSPAHLAQKYSLTDLAPFTTPFGYRGNHWTLHYYRFNVYRHSCPRQMFANGPTYRDIEAAFAQAIIQVGQVRQGVQFMNSSTPSFAARHQIFSYLSQQNARMDEEGLLVELVSQYLAERLCLTKWDRQRYLPQLTRLISASQFPPTHSCAQYYSNPWRSQTKNCHLSKYRTYDGFCNNPYHLYWGKTNVCHIRLMSPDYADGVSLPRESHNSRYPLPNPRLISNSVHNDIPLEGPYNLMKMQWGQFINHDISNTALSSYDGLVDCCKQPQTRGCWPILVPGGDRFYGGQNITCLSFIRSGVCPTCQLGPRQQTNKNTAFLDASHVYGVSVEQASQLRAFVKGQLRTTAGKGGEQLLPIASSQEQCVGTCYMAGDSRVNQHPALTALHLLLVRNHNFHAAALARRHPEWTDELLYQEARRLNIAEYQMITYNEYLPIVFGPILSAYFQLIPQRSGYTQYNPKTDPSTWNEYTTAACRFGHSQISSVFGLYSRILGYGQTDQKQSTYRLKEWFMRPQFLADGFTTQIINGLLARPSMNVDPWITTDCRDHLYQTSRDNWGGDLAATNIWRGRDHGLPGYVHYLEYCFNYKVRGWRELQLFIPNYTLNQLRKLYKVVENIDLFAGGLAERHFPGADIGPTFACINGIQYNHLKYGDRFYFEHANQAGSFNQFQLEEIKRSTLARLLCRTAQLPQVPQYAFLQPSMYNPLVNCSQLVEVDYTKF